MDLSSASDADLEALTEVHNTAIPGYVKDGANTCVDNHIATNLYHNLEDEPVANVLSNAVRFKIDTTAGASGSPFYFCPEGGDPACPGGGGEVGTVYGVLSAYLGGPNRVAGPKVPAHRADMLLILP